MALTQPRSEQLRFVSAATGSHVLDTYLEAAERGGRTLSDLLSDIFDEAGLLLPGYLELRITSGGDVQYRITGTGAWTTLQTIFLHRGAWATATVYNRTDTVTFGGQLYVCTTAHTAGASFAGDSANWVVALQLAGNPVYFRGTFDASTGSYPAAPEQGDLYVASVAGTVSSVDYGIGDMALYNGASWDRIENNAGDRVLKSGDTMTGNLRVATAIYIGALPAYPSALKIIGSAGEVIAGAPSDNLATFANNGNVAISIQGGTSGTATVYFGTGGAGGNTKGRLVYNFATHEYSVYTDGTKRFSISSTGAATFEATALAKSGMPMTSYSGTSYSIATGSNGLYIRSTGASANTFNVLTNAAAALPVGAEIVVFQAGTGQVTFAPSGGVTINSKGGSLALAGQYSAATLKKVATDEWDLIGDLA